MDPSAPPRVGAALLAGGSSRRMGRPKAALTTPSGERFSTVVGRALGAVAGVGVVAGHGEGVDDALGWPRVPDHRPGAGPLAGIEAALATGLAEIWIVAPCDMPDLTAAHLQPLVDALRADPGASAAAWADADAPTGLYHLPLALRASALPALQAALDADRRALGGLLHLLRPLALPPPDALEAGLRNVNTPADLPPG